MFCQIFFGPFVIKSFQWKKNKKILKRNYEILEVGCGDGKYGKLLKKIIGRNFKSYLGIDIKKRERWDNSGKKFKIYKIRLL